MGNICWRYTMRQRSIWVYHGSMLDGVNAAGEWNVRNGFPGMLAKKYDRELINISMPGGSNQYIFRSVLKYMHHYMDDEDDHMFLINWTGTTRFELRYPNQLEHLYFSKGDRKTENRLLVWVSKLVYPWKRSRITKVWTTPFDVDQLSNKWASYAYNLQQILELHNIPFRPTHATV